MAIKYCKECESIQQGEVSRCPECRRPVNYSTESRIKELEEEIKKLQREIRGLKTMIMPIGDMR
jgi:transcription initiation factor IIE alpha subunit